MDPVTQQYLDTDEGRRRVVTPGAPFVGADWTGWAPVPAGELVAGHWVRMHRREFVVTEVRPFDDKRSHVSIRGGEFQVPALVWSGCLVWTFVG